MVKNRVLFQMDDACWGGEGHAGLTGQGASGKTRLLRRCSTRAPVIWSEFVWMSYRVTQNALNQWRQRHQAKDTVVVADAFGCFGR